MPPKKPKVYRSGDLHTSQPFDQCQTPAYGLDPLLPYLRQEWTIWEPAAGERNLVRALQGGGHTVVDSDILDTPPRDFFRWEPQQFNAIVTNPPYSTKYDFLRRCYELGKPFALLVPVETIAAAKAQRMYTRYGFEWLLLDKRINFKMPLKNYEGSGAHIPTFWFTWGLNIGAPVTIGRIVRRSDEQLRLFEEAA